MSVPSSCTTLRLPTGFPNLLQGLVLEVLREQPADVVAFAAQHFQRLLEHREEGSADPMAWAHQLEDQPFPQLLAQEPAEDAEKEDKDKKKEEEE